MSTSPHRAAKDGDRIAVSATAVPQYENEIYPTVCLCGHPLIDSKAKRLHAGNCPCTGFDDPELVALIHKRRTYSMWKELYTRISLSDLAGTLHIIDELLDSRHSYGSSYNAAAAEQSLNLVLAENGGNTQ